LGKSGRADEAPVVDLGLPKNNGAWADLVQLFGTLSLGMHQFPHPHLAAIPVWMNG